MRYIENGDKKSGKTTRLVQRANDFAKGGRKVTFENVELLHSALRGTYKLDQRVRIVDVARDESKDIDEQEAVVVD